MRSQWIERLVAAVALLGVGCQDRGTDETPTALVKLTPASVRADGVATEDVWRLFDRSTSSSIAPAAGTSIVVDLGGQVDVAALKVHGPAPYTLEVDGFGATDLSQLAAGWHVLLPESPVDAARLSLALTPTGGTGALSEIEVWAAADSATAPATVSATAAPLLGQLSLEATCADFTVSLDVRPEHLRRAYLAYSTDGIFRSFAVKRWINGGAEQGGAWLAPEAGKREVTEEIDPASLRAGDNTISFCLAEGATRGANLSGVRLVGEIDRGVSLAATPPPREAAAGERILVPFDRLIAPDLVTLASAEGPSSVECVDRGGIAAPLELTTRPVPSGSLTLLDGGDRACAALALTFAAPVSLADLDIVGSGAADRVDWPRIVVSSEREHFGDVAWVGGFVARPSAMTGAIRLAVDGAAAESLTGDFGRLVRRASADDSAWPVDVTARFPDGTDETSTVILGRNGQDDVSASVVDATEAPSAPATPPDSRFGAEGDAATQIIKRAKGGSVRLGSRVGVELPAGAVDAATKVTVRHLGEDVLPPLDPGMINVTAPARRGYEFLPHGARFKKKVEVVVPYDPRLIPDGMTPADVNTYFYDTRGERWVKLERAAVDIGDEVTRSLTDHFTIMINAVLAVPENPNPLSFDPTALSSIAAASPAANVDLVEPPIAVNTGDATVSYPIRLPAGRGAFSPELSLQYSSGGGDGWLGVGWDLTTSKIEIDTRFGVPTYAGAEEEVRYLLDGAPLVPTLETDGPSCRDGSTGRRYHTRVESAFAHILRCGVRHDSFYFEVRGRDGTLFVYGDEVDPGFLLRASLHNYTHRDGIFAFHLREVIDRHGNRTLFEYQTDASTGSSTEEQWRIIYPKQITYTTHESATFPPYKVEFLLDDGTRPDPIISGRAGFKMVTRRLLRAIRVSFSGEVVREYVLTYRRGQFSRSILASVRAYGTGGCASSDDAFSTPGCTSNLFHQHEFDYHVEEQGFDPVQSWLVVDDPDTEAARLGRGHTRSRGGTFSLSLDGEVGSIGGQIGRDSGRRAEMVGMYDVNGDGLVDQLYREPDTIVSPSEIIPGELFVLYNQFSRASSEEGASFFSRTGPDLFGLQDLGFEKSKTSSGGLFGTVGGDPVGFSASAGMSNSVVRAERIVTDVNGDGFIDVVLGEARALLGQPCPEGMCFSETPFAAIDSIDPGEDSVLQATLDEVGERLPLGNPVVQWVAPFPGEIRIDATAQKVLAGGEDGVTVVLTHGDDLVEARTLEPDDTQVAVLANGVTFQVDTGSTVYLRVRTGTDEGIDDGTFHDLVDTHLVVTYLSACDEAPCSNVVDPETARDPSGRPIFRFDSADDFRVTGAPAPVIAPAGGTIQLRGILAKPVTEADLRACVQRFSMPADPLDLDLNWPCEGVLGGPENVTGTFAFPADAPALQPIVSSIDVEAGDLLLLRVESDLSFYPVDVRFDALAPGLPRLSYTRVCVPEEDETIACTTDPETLAETPLVASHFSPFVPLIDRQPGVARRPYVAPLQGSLRVEPPGQPSEPYLFAIRSDRQGLIHQEDCRQMSCGGIDPPSVTVTAGESITFELLTESGTYPTSLIAVSYGGDHLEFVPLHVRALSPPDAPRTPLAGGYRNFSYVFWNEKRAFAPTALLEDFADLEAQSPERRFEIAQSVVTPLPYAVGASFAPSPAFIAPFSVAFVTAHSSHAAFIGAAELDENGPSAEELLDGNYARLSTTRSYSAGLALVFGQVLNLVFTVALSDTKTTTDLIDLDGDGVSDVVAAGKVRLGDLSAEESVISDLVLEDHFRGRKSTEYSIGFEGAAAVTPKTTSSGRTISVDGLKGPDRGRLGLKTGIGFGIGRSETRKDLVDINGDGLPDRVRRDGNAVKVSFNLGNHYGTEEVYGQVQGGTNSMLLDDDDFVEHERDVKGAVGLDTERMPLDHDTTVSRHRSSGINLVLVDLSKSSHQTSTRTTRQLADINGDGLPDLLFKRAQDDFIRVQLNRGGDFAPPVRWPVPDWDSGVLPTNFDSRIGDLGISGPDVLAATGRQTSRERAASVNFIVGSVGGSSSSKTDAYEMSLLDIDGDGTADHVLRRGSEGTFSFFHVKRNKVTGLANLLKSVHRPLRGSFDLDYAMTDATVDMPGRRPVLAKVTVSDGINLGTDFASPDEVVELEYRDGFFDRGEKEFFGFREVITRRADGGRVEQEFENRTYALRGRLVRETRRGADDFNFVDRILTHEVKPVLDASDDALTPDPACIEALHPLLGSEACLPVFPVVVREEERRFEKGSGVLKARVTRDLEHTRFGDVVASIDEGDGDIASDDIHARASYLNDPSRWIMGLPLGLEVRAGSESGPILRRRFGLYENGDLVQVSLDTGSGLARTTLAYDTFGNVRQVTTPPNASGQAQTVDVAYDPVAHTYPVRVVDGFGLQSTAGYDLRFGVAVLETDTNGASTTRTLDSFGRLETVRGPYDTDLPALAFEYHPDSFVPHAVSVNTPSAPGSYAGPVPPPITTVTAIDGLGRAIQVRKTAVVNGVLGMTTGGTVRRDSLGRVDREYHPFFTPGVSETFQPPALTHFTAFEYDDLDRPVLTRHPDDFTETTSYTITAPPGGVPLFREQTRDANGHPRESFADHLDRVRAFVEHPSATESSINRYEYSALGELIGITDAEGNQTQLGYDLRGLRTSMSNPDTGLIEERFDLMGNRVALIEPNHRALGVEVQFLHDRDRLVGINYPSKPDVTYSYGAPGAAFGRAGRIAEVRDETGRVESFYGRLGEVVRTVREVNAGNPDKPVRFDSRFVHDSFGRLLTMSYPDGEVVTNRYDDAGQLLSVTGAGQNWSRVYASELRYDVFGNRIRARFGNGAVTTWKFDDRRVRLSELTSTLASNARVQDLRYQYDPAGNPVAISTLLPAPGPSSKLPGGASLTMTYDGVDRLVLAKGTSQLTPQKATIYEQTFSYSPSHNLLGKKRTHLISQPSAGGMPTAPADTNIDFAYLYGGPRPHAPTRVGDLDIEYDASGNPILRRRSSTGRAENLIWDDDGRMVEFQGGSTHQRNTFDAAGNRVVRQGANRTTIFVSPFFDLEGSSQGVKHIFAGDTRVASILAAYAAPLPATSPLPPAKPGSAFYFHQDHLGSTAVLTDDRGDVYQHLEYFPDGQVWIDSGPQQPVNGYLFSGKPFDPDTGFSDFGQRFYDPRTSVWLGVDSAFTDEANKSVQAPLYLASYAYAGHSPMANVDLDGREWWRRFTGAGKVAAGGAGFTVGVGLCVTLVGCAVGIPLAAASADVAGSGVGEIVTGEAQPTLVGELAGPAAQEVEESVVGGAGLAGWAAGARVPVASGGGAATEGRRLFSAGGSSGSRTPIRAGGGQTPSPLAAGSGAGATPIASFAARATGQLHHAISRPVHRALEQHPVLRGAYRARDPRFVLRAADQAAHRGYQQWHRILDQEVANWLRVNEAATPAQFERYLRSVYQRPDLVQRFPRGFE